MTRISLSLRMQTVLLNLLLLVNCCYILKKAAKDMLLTAINQINKKACESANFELIYIMIFFLSVRPQNNDVLDTPGHNFRHCILG